MKTLYHAVNGVAPDLATEVRNMKYLDAMRGDKKFAVYTGWRIYDTAQDTEVAKTGDGVFGFEYTKIDF